MKCRLAGSRADFERMRVEPGSCTWQKRTKRKLKTKSRNREDMEWEQKVYVKLNNVAVWELLGKQTGKRSFEIRKN